ncbi:BUD13 homolog [Hypomesus transpacificus]|uniref:BUD13 homolog n=1 Tax=Hypomesus transpacificus TaxID=137520 RepID=UPI001F081407|nr:BUD13 homolog [Hypomesus transpacificus]
MAASTSNSKGVSISKAEYLKRYLSADGDGKKSKEKNVKKKRVKVTGRGMKIVDDDVDWKQLVNSEENENEEEEEEAPVVAEMIDERPEDVKQLEAFRTSTKWRVMGVDEEDNEEEEEGQDTGSTDSRNAHHDSPEPTPGRKTRHDSPDNSPLKRTRHDSPDASQSRHQMKQSADSPPAKKNANSSSGRSRKPSPDSDQSPPRRRAKHKAGSDSDQSPPRRKSKSTKCSDSDQSPPRRRPKRGQDSDSDLSPPRRPDQSQAPRMLSGGAAGLVSIDVLREEQEENRRREKINRPLEDQSRNAQTVFRDKSGKRRDLEVEREEQKRKAAAKAEKDEKYAQWGKGLVQGQMQNQNIEDAVLEAQKPFARHRDDEDLDRMLREQERDGDPMAAMLRRKKEKDSKLRGVKEKPRYKGPPPPPNRFNIHPGYRWDGVDRSNGFEQKRYTRIADKMAVQEVAYKWSVEDM